MKKVNVLNRSILEAMYPNGYVPMFDDNLSHSRYRTCPIQSLPEKIMVSTQTGAVQDPILPFTMLRLLKQSSDYRFLLAPNAPIEDLEVPEFIDIIIPVLEELMPGKYFIKKDGSYHYVFLHYPELEITNNLGGKHTIYDMVVRLDIIEDVLQGHISGMRYSFTRDELASGYIHSHLPTNYFEGCQTFCLGTSQLAEFMARGKVQDADTFAMLLLQIEAYLKWESLEGSPYLSIERLGTARNFTPVPSIGNIQLRLLREVAREFVNQLTPDLLTKRGVNDYIVTIGEGSEKLFEIEQAVVAKFPNLSDYMYHYDLDRKYYIRSGSGNDRSLPQVGRYELTIGAALKISRRLVEVPEPVEPRIIRRLSQLQLDYLIGFVNSYLGSGRIINETNRLTSQSESNNIKDTSVSSDVFTF